MSRYIILPNGRPTNFTLVELACRHCGKFNYHPGVLDKIQDVRDDLNEAMMPTSGCRCDQHNTAVGGKRDSFHICDRVPDQHKGRLGCMAVDLATPSPMYRGRLFACLWKHGFTVGINFTKNFLHGDQRRLIGWEQTTFPY